VLFCPTGNGLPLVDVNLMLAAHSFNGSAGPMVLNVQYQIATVESIVSPGVVRWPTVLVSDNATGVAFNFVPTGVLNTICDRHALVAHG
jgi:hypothetical protein